MVDAAPMYYYGFQDVANALSTSERAISRQQVYAWWQRRANTGFPSGTRVSTSGRGSCWRFDAMAVQDWYAGYVPRKGGRPRKE